MELVNNSSAFKRDAVEDGDPTDMLIPTINFATGQIERNGKPMQDQPVYRESPMAFMFEQDSGFVGNIARELNEEPYPPPTLDSDRLVSAPTQQAR